MKSKMHSASFLVQGLLILAMISLTAQDALAQKSARAGSNCAVELLVPVTARERQPRS